MKYIDNNLYKFSDLFQTLIIIYINKEIQFTDKNEIDKAIWMLQSNSLLKHQNKKLVLFNDIFSNIAKNIDVNNFREIVMSKVKDVCDIGFCIFHSSVKHRESLKDMDNYYSISKNHKYCLINNIETIKHINNLNDFSANDDDNILFNLSEIDNLELLEKFEALGIVSYMDINVEYYDVSKGVNRFLQPKGIMVQDWG
ncbi:MAG: hypothetical protein ACREVX_00035 [Clostridium sp.]|uniref:hypothetical protein n=1 Tax=Clostridium sp. TaxID=1506 RepID=UPI003D6D0490